MKNMKQKLTKLKKIISEHPKSEIYFEDCSDSETPRVIYNVKFIKDGYIFEGRNHANRDELKEYLYFYTFWYPGAHINDKFKDIAKEYLLSHNVEELEDLPKENRDELINLFIDKVQPKDYILVSLDLVDGD